MSIRVGILGYGNLGRGVECAVKHNPDMELKAVFTRRDPSNVKILTKIKNKKLLIEISNTYTNEIQRKEDRFYSTKHGGFGIGTASVTEVVQKVGGYVTFCTEDGVFKVNIFLPVKIATEV